jgi:hypothetical protein
MIYNPDDPPHLECQDCGEKLKELTQAEQKIVAERPYDFIGYCRECKIYHKYGDL